MASEISSVKTILVVCFPLSGSGDFFGALKIADLCKNFFKSHQVVFALPEKWAEERPRLIEREVAYPLVTYDGLDTKALTATRPEAVMGFICDGGSADPICEAVCEELDTPPAYLPLTECGGYPPKGGFALGVDKGEIGLLIDPTLALEPKGLHQLANISPDLCKEILGSPYSEEAAKAFDEEWKLYFGYSNKPASRQWFMDAVTEFNAACDDKRKPLFVLVGPEGSDLKAPDRAKVISHTFLDHKEMRALLLASEEECLATGDLSPTDLFAADKTPLLETLDHKGYFTRAILDRAEEQSWDLRMLVSDVYYDPSKYSNPSIAARALFTIKTNDAANKAKKAFTETIRTKHNASIRILAELQKRMQAL